jgi:hypothetical protein
MLRATCLIVMLFTANACLDEPPPDISPAAPDVSSSTGEVDWACMLPGAVCSCAAYGCAYAPSGTPDIWTPCDAGDICYCRVSNTVTRACRA